MDERAPASGKSASGAGGEADAELESAREEFLRRLLERLESGQLAASEYTERVRHLERATTVAEMAEAAGGIVGPVAGLDPVDMLLLARSTKSNGHPAAAGSRPRYFIVGVLLFFFVVLIVVGLWLVSHARALHNSGGVGVVPAATAPYDAGPASPPSLRSSRR